MVVITKKVICKSKIYDDCGIVLEIEDEVAGCYLTACNNGASETEKIEFENVEDVEIFCTEAKKMLAEAQSQCDDKE